MAFPWLQPRPQPRPVGPTFVYPKKVDQGVHGSAAPTVARVYLSYFEVSAHCLLDQVFLQLGAAYNNNVRVGIYRDVAGTPQAGALLYDSGDLAPAGGTSVTAAMAQHLQVGRYWAAVEFDTATANAFYRGAGLNFPEASMLRGCNYDRGGGYGAFTNPCPAVVLDNATAALVSFRVSHWWAE